MADLYAGLGNNSQKVLQKMDNTGPALSWLVFQYIGEGDGFTTGSTDQEQLQAANTLNFQVLRALQQRCEIYEVVRPSSTIMSVQVRANTVPYAEGEAENDASHNSLLEAELVRSSIPDVQVWNGLFRDDNVNWD